MFRGQKKQVIDESMSVFYVTYCLQSNLDLRRRTRKKATNAALIEDYGFCTMDGHRAKIGNFR